MSKTFVICLLLYGVYCLPVLLQGNINCMASSESINMIKVITTVMFVESMLYRGDKLNLYQGFTRAALLLLSLNLLITFLLNPNGIYNGFSQGEFRECFLGNKNTVRNPLMLGFVCSALLDEQREMAITARTCLVIVVGLLNLILVWSATSLVVYLVACLLYCCSLCNISIPNIRYFELGALISCLLVVFVRKLNVFSHFIVDILGKDMTFSDRTAIWDSALNDALDSPLFGIGLGSEIVYSNPNNPFLRVSHCHNAYIDSFYKGGIVGLLLFLEVVRYSCSAISSIQNSRVRSILIIAVASFLFMGIFGELLNPCFISLLAMGNLIGNGDKIRQL